MKAVMLGMRYLTNALGNVIDIVVMKAFEGVLPKQAYEFFLFGGLTLICMAIFAWMSLGYQQAELYSLKNTIIFYRYVDYTSTENQEDEIKDDKDAKNEDEEQILINNYILV